MHRMSRFLVVGMFPLAAGGLTGCATHPAAQVPASLKCEPTAALLAPCAAPVALKAGLTYREMLDAHLADRQQLQRCAARSSDSRASTQRAPSGVCSFFQNGAWVLR